MKGTSTTKSTFDPYTSTVSFGDRANDRQAQAGAGLFARLTLPGPIELFEQARLVIGWNANAGIGHFENHIARFNRGAQRHPSTPGRVLDRILDEVVDSLM